MIEKKYILCNNDITDLVNRVIDKNTKLELS